MTTPIVRDASRRRFLQYLAASPLSPRARCRPLAPKRRPNSPTDDLGAGRRQPDQPAEGRDQRIRLRTGRRQNVPPAHFGYMASGLDDEVTLRATARDS